MSASDLHEYYNWEIGGHQIIKTERSTWPQSTFYIPLIMPCAAPIWILIGLEKDEWATRRLNAHRSSFLFCHTQVLIVLSLLGAARETGLRLSLTSPPLLVRRKVLQANRGVLAPCRGRETVEYGSQAVVHCRLLNDDNMHGSEFNTI